MCKQGFCTYLNKCCTSSSQCDDNRSCTSNACSGGKCKFTKAAGASCCTANKDCNDGKACTLDLCQQGKCTHAKLAQCCESNQDCDDGDDKCTDDVCDVKTGKCSFTKTCCAKDADCNDGDDKCTKDTCNMTTSKCAFTPTGAQGCCLPQLWSHNFDDGKAKGMTFSNKYGATKGWQVWNPASYYKSAKGALYYGDPVAKNYKFSGTNYGTATMPEITLPNKTGLKLRFWAWFDKETSSTYDKLTVRLKPSGGSTTTLWYTTSSVKDNIWYDKSFSLDAYKGQKVTISFYFSTGDSSGNTELGVLIDDLQVTQTCP